MKEISRCPFRFPDLVCKSLLKGIFNDNKLCGTYYFCNNKRKQKVCCAKITLVYKGKS